MILTDKSGNGNVLINASYNSKRVGGSVLEVETYTFKDFFDSVFTLRNELSSLLHRRVPIAMIADPDCLFNVVIRPSKTIEKRLMIDMADDKDD